MMKKVNSTTIFRRRVYAFGTDLIFLSLFNKAIIFAYINFIKSYFLFDKVISEAKINFYFEDIGPLIFLCLSTAYFSIGHYIGSGQTIGKVIFDIKIVANNGPKDIDLTHSLLIVLDYYLTILTFGIMHLRIFKGKKSLSTLLTQTGLIDTHENPPKKTLQYFQIKKYTHRS